MITKKFSRPFIFSLILAVSLFLYSCSKDDTLTPTDNTFDGGWTVDQVQMVSAPSGSGLSAMMKQALVPFGSVSGSFVGYMDVNFNIEHFDLTPTAFNFMHALKRMSFKGNTGYAQAWGFNSGIYLSENGGMTWNSLNLPLGTLADFYQVNESKLYILYLNNSAIKLGRSTNKGASWDTLTTNLSQSLIFGGSHLQTFVFTDDNNGCIMTLGGIFKTTDGGHTWINKTSYTGENAGGMVFDQNTGVVITYKYGSFEIQSRKTTDGGNTWSAPSVLSNTSYGIREMYFLNPNTGWINSQEFDKFALIKVTNGFGADRVYSGAVLHWVMFLSENEGYSSSRNIILKTNDGGANWNPLSSPEMGGVNTIQNVNGQPVYFLNFGIMRAAGSDPSKWSAKGKITNSAIKMITNAKDEELFVNGEYNTSNSTIVFTINNYSVGGNQNVGAGTFAFENGYLDITLNLANNEKWMIRLRRR